MQEMFAVETEELPDVKYAIRPGMASILRIALVAPIVEPGNKSANLAKFIDYIREASAKGADIVLLPEVALTGFISKPATWDRPLGQVYEWAETIPGPSVDRLITVAREYNIYIIMGMFEADSEFVGRLHNSVAFVGPKGLVGRYRKNTISNRALFAEHHWGLAPGFEIPVWEIGQGWRIALTICYDMWVPEVPRVAAVKGADLILCSSFTPAACREAWFRVLQTRALENQTGVARVSAAGTYHAPYIPRGMSFEGSRIAVEATGEVIINEGTPDTEGMSIATFAAENLYRGRGLLPELRDRQPEAYQALVKPNKLASDIIPYI